MRRSAATTVLCIVPALVAGAVALTGCEDGPNQTYSPATGTLFNNGTTPDGGVVGVAEASLDASYAGRTVLQPCSPDLQRRRWAKMLTEPMEPPVHFAGLWLNGVAPADGGLPTEWPGLSVEQAEQAPDLNTLQGGNCQGVATGNGTCGENSNDVCGNVTWGNNGEVNFSYDLATHIIDQLDINLGYLGTLTAYSFDNSKLDPPDPGLTHNTYVMTMGLPILKNGKPFQIEWGSDNQVKVLYNAIMHTYAASIGYPFPAEDPNCHTSGTCLVISNDGAGNGYFGIRPMATYFIFHSSVPQPAASEPYFLYIDYAKFVPSSTLAPTLTLGFDGKNIGPSTNGLPIGVTSGSPCVQRLGETYKEYLANCIEPYSGSSAALNQVNYEKLIGGHTHNLEEITFNIVGVNQDFALTPDIGAYGVVDDTALPSDSDVSSEWYFDVRAFGTPHNEFQAGKENFIGTGLVYREYQRLVEMDLAAKLGKLPSAPQSCQFVSDNSLAGAPVCVDPATGKSIVAKAGNPACNVGGPLPVDSQHVCTGFEGMIYPGTYQAAADPKSIQSYLDGYIGFGLGSALKPGDHYTFFTENAAAAVSYAGYGGAFPYFGYDFGYFWDGSLQWVVRVLGKGDIRNLPVDAQDRRYYFKWFGVALVKYLKAYGAIVQAGGNVDTITPQDVANQPIDLETLFFDNEFGAQFDKIEYIDLSTIAGKFGNTNPPGMSNPESPTAYQTVPLDYEYGTDVKVANQRYSNWYKRLDREEYALYNALAPTGHKSDPAGTWANFGVNLTNMFGSPVLAAMGLNYECVAVPFKTNSSGAIAWTNTDQFPTASTDCVKAKASIPSWLMDANGNSLMDLDGQQAAKELAECPVQPPSAECQAAAKAYKSVNSFGCPTGTTGGCAHTLLWQYPAAVQGTNTVFGMGHSPIQVCPVGATNCKDPSQPTSKTSVAIEAAQVYIPNFLNPWSTCATQQTVNGKVVCDPASGTFVDQAHAQYSFVPWLPPQPGVGFEIAVNGSSDLVVQTAQLDFTGNLETYLVDYRPYQDIGQTSCAGGQTCRTTKDGADTDFTCVAGTCVASDNSIEVMAIEAHDFLGNVFVCQDPTTTDVLHVRMYSPMGDILQWLADHPGNPNDAVLGIGSAQTACGIIIRYSPFDNYPDFLTSLSNGIRLNTNEGQGFGRIVDATLFNTQFETITQ